MDLIYSNQIHSNYSSNDVFIYIYMYSFIVNIVLDGGIRIVEMLYRSNIIALVGGGVLPTYMSSKLMIWDDNKTKIISEFKFTTQVKNVKLRQERIFVVLEQKIFVFDFKTFQQVDTIDTSDNPNGIFALNTDPTITIIAYPADMGTTTDEVVGYVKVKSYETNINALIRAHQSKIGCLTLNHNGTLLATASEKGTIIRIFETSSGVFLQDVRRGSDKTIIHHMCFSRNSLLLAATSNKGTVHIWSVKESKDKLLQSNNNNSNSNSDNNNNVPQNKVSMFKGLPYFISGGFFKSEWSFAQVRIDDTTTKAICCFTEEDNCNYIVIVTQGGWYYKARIDMVNGGKCLIVKKESLSEASKNINVNNERESELIGNNNNNNIID